MVNTTCAMRDCLSSSRIDTHLRFHQFPRTQERCELWVEACRRQDLYERTAENLKYMYICSLHFEKRMYAKKILKKTAIPTLLLPIKDSVHTQTDPAIDVRSDEILDRTGVPSDVVLDLQDRHKTIKREILESDDELARTFLVDSSKITENTSTKQYLCSNCNCQAQVSEHAPKKIIKFDDPLFNTSNNLKCISEKYEDDTIEQFFKSCDKFLSPKLSAMVKEELSLKIRCKMENED